MSIKAFSILIASIILLLAVLPGCGIADRNEVRVYLIINNSSYNGAESERILRVNVEPQPIIASQDIVAYHWETHQIELTRPAIERLKNLSVPVDAGRPYIVFAGNTRVYMGAIWTSLSSNSYSGTVILQPLDTANNTVTIQLGYPADYYFQGDDPRSDARIQSALQSKGILKEAS